MGGVSAVLKSFPQPLNAKEEEECLKALEQGDKTARQTLIEHNLRLVAHIVKKYDRGDKEMEDLISIGVIGLMKAIDSFDPGKGIHLATYASRCIDNELLMMFRASKKYGRDVYLYEPIGADKEGNEINLLDVICLTEEDIIESVILTESVRSLYRLLETMKEGREKKILIMRYGLYGTREYTQREIAEELGISRSYVSRLEKKALQRLKKELEDPAE